MLSTPHAPTVESLTAAVVSLLEGDFAPLSMEALYQLFSDVLSGQAPSSVDPLARDFVDVAGSLIERDYSHLDRQAITLALGRAAQQADLRRRSGGHPEVQTTPMGGSRKVITGASLVVETTRASTTGRTTAFERPEPTPPPTPGDNAGFSRESSSTRTPSVNRADEEQQTPSPISDRRLRAAARSHATSGTFRNPADDDLRRFGRRTGRREVTAAALSVPAQPDTGTAVPPGSVTRPMAGGSPSGPPEPRPLAPTQTAQHETVDPPLVDVADHARVGETRRPWVGERTGGYTAAWATVTGSTESAVELGSAVDRWTLEPFPGVAAAALIRAAAHCRASVVTIESPGRSWTVVLREDQLLQIEASPEEASYSFEHVIRISGLIEPTALDAAIREANESGSSAVDVLLERRLLRHRQLDAIVNARCQLMLRALFDESPRSVTIVGHDSVEASSVSPIQIAHIAWAHLAKVCNEESQEELEASIAKHLSDRPLFRADVGVGPAALRVGSRERRFVEESLVGAVALAPTLSRSPLRRRPTLALIVALDRANLLTWQRMETSAMRIARTWGAVQQKLRELGTANPFDLLDAHWSSDDHLIAEAYRTVLRELDLEYILSHGTEAEKAVAERVRLGLTRVRDQLQDRAQRQKIRAETVDVFSRRTAVQLYEKQSELALFKEDYGNAIDALRRVLELSPSHGTARAQLDAILHR